jgi:hypothetical protein
MMQLVIIVLTKRKEMIRYCEMFRNGGTTLSNIIANDLTHISVPVEDGSQYSTTFTNALRGSSTFMPTHTPSRLVLSYLL